MDKEASVIDNFLKEQIAESGILQAINRMDLANYPDAQQHLAKFLEEVGLSPEIIITNYKSPEAINEMKKEVDNTFEAITTTIS